MLEEKLKKKRKKKKTETGLGMYVVDDDDDAWNDGLSKQGKGKDLWQDERTDYDEEQPTVVGDGAEDYDPESQPIVANAEEFFERERTEELEKQWLAAETKPSDLSEASSPSRQKEDLSPPRKVRHEDNSPPRRRKKVASATQQAAFQDEALMGKQAETIYRDKRGRKLDMLMEMQRQQEIQDGKRKREAKEEFEWGTGKVRKEELRSHQQELDAMRAKAKPRAFDPMESSLFKDDVDDTAKKGPKKNQKPTYAGPPAPPNRFNIPPGYRWDGVVRGNNWEEKALLQVNARKAHKQDMYQWATADM
ncbi:hypothetical protein DYB28_006339 [Aphanomyces astaci]|uniref:Pre-mRNA-splicing factor CWC26 n=1 Tax=Aphanomyces astaci TaxID=112090 RepID=A0A3L6VMM8_APHAT|nr:hypothetical protein DYB35_007307 [Aphanomyces astaci]RLO10037.1 hypothetical protein DYB28_006339 [Aphanomyces astaci]